MDGELDRTLIDLVSGLDRSRWRAVGGIYGGGALALGCAAGLLHQFGILGRF